MMGEQRGWATGRRTWIGLLVMALLSIAGAASAANFDAASSIAERGLLPTLAAVFLGGVLVSVTPCLYPMIPITLGAIGARNVGQGALRGFLRSFTFVGGIALVYAGLGLVAAFTGGSMGRLLSQWWVWGFMAALFAIMGVSMMGAFTLELPPALAGKLQGKVAGKQGFLGAFLLGIVTGVVASPCGSPVLASVLLMAAQQGQAFVGGLLLVTYALGIGLLFLVLGAFPALLKKIPKSGGWMEDVKKFLGALLIGVAFYYLQFARVPDFIYWPLVLAVTIGGGLVVAIRATRRSGDRLRFLLWRLGAVGLGVFSIYVAVAKVPSSLLGTARPGNAAVAASDAASNNDPTAMMADAKVALRSASKTTSGTTASDAPVSTEWLRSEPDALAAGQKLGRPVMLDFRADWCPACVELEHKTFSDPAVKEALARFVTVKVDCTELTDETEALQKKYKSVSLPTVAFVDQAGRIRHELTLYTFEKPADFLRRLKQVEDAK